MPVWLLTYNFGAKAYQVVVNGVTGRMAGDYPKSFWKIALLVLLAIIAVARVRDAGAGVGARLRAQGFRLKQEPSRPSRATTSSARASEP